MQTPTAEQVRTLAPDGAAARAGQVLADPRRWSAAGRTTTAAWGLCQGSGSSPYQTAADLEGPAYKCSCPSHKIPCKHALGLLFLLTGGTIAAAEPPDWVRDWLASRAARAEAAATRAERPAPIDEAARARRIESRQRKVAAGIEELDRWLVDLIRRGLDEAHAEGYRFWDAMGARLVDAQAPGLGRSVRSLGAAASGGTRWPHALLEGAGRLHLLSAAYRRLDELPEPLRADVRSLVGWTVKEDELDPADTVEDRWAVVGRTVDDSGQVITARTFLLGEASHRWALHLAFGVYDAPPNALAEPPSTFRATLVFYPSATPLRALVRPVIVPDGELSTAPPGMSIAEALAAHAGRLAANPFVGRWPVALAGVTPVVRAGRLFVRDDSGSCLALEPGSVAARIITVSAGHPVTFIGEWDGTLIRPLSIYAEGRLVPLEASDDDLDASDRGDVLPTEPPGWPELVSAALLGTERSGGAAPVPAAISLPESKSAERTILAAAAAVAVRRRAGAPASRDTGSPPAAATMDERPPVGGAAASLFGFVANERPSLLAEAIALVEASGRRVPDEWLPAALSAAASDPELLDAIGGLSGERVRWLASADFQGFAEFRTVAQLASAAGARTMAEATPSDREASWSSTGSARERVALVRAMRRADPAAAREALGRWLPDVGGDERAEIVAAFDEGLEPADEPLLTLALVERRLDVRRTAADLLVRIDGSRLGELIEGRARPLLGSHRRVRQGLSVVLPEIDDELEAAGFGGKPPQGLGERAWLLRQIIGHVRPRRWTEWLGAEPAAIVDRALRADEAGPILQGLVEAAGRFEDGDWLVALLANGGVAEHAEVDQTRALMRFRPGERAAVVTRAARSVDPKTLARLAALCPGPWPEELAEATLAAIEKLAESEVPDQGYFELVRAAATGIRPELAGRLANLASHGDRLRPALEGAVETIRFRAELGAAFAALPPLTNKEPR